VLVTDVGRFYTFSEVIKKACERISETLNEGYYVRAKIVKRKNYYTLE